MEGLLSILAFGAGTAIGLKAVKVAESGLRSTVRTIAGGIATAETVCSLASRLGRALSEAAVARQRPGATEPGSDSGRTAEQGRQPLGPRRIEIIKE